MHQTFNTIIFMTFQNLCIFIAEQFLFYQNYSLKLLMSSFEPKTTTPSKASNPQMATPSTIKLNTQITPLIQPQRDFIQQVYQLLNQHRFRQAFQLCKNIPSVRDWVADRLLCYKISEIVFTNSGSPGFSKINIKHELLSLEQCSLLQGLHSLKDKKGLNDNLVTSLSRHLQEIINEQYQQITSVNNSKIFLAIYSKLNQIHKTIQLYKSKSGIQIDKSLKQQLNDLFSKNSTLLVQIENNNAAIKQLTMVQQKTIMEKIQLLNQNQKLKISNNQHQKQQLALKDKFVHQMNIKDSKFKCQLMEIRSLNRHQKESSIVTLYKELDVSIQDFKSLIVKLSQQNKILREQKQILLAKLTDIYTKIQNVIVKEKYMEEEKKFSQQAISQLKQNKQILEKMENVNASQENQNKHKLIEDLRKSMQNLSSQIQTKNQFIEEITKQLQQLKNYKIQNEKDLLNKSISFSNSSVDNSDRKKPKIQRNNIDRLTKQNIQKDQQISCLQNQRKKDYSIIQQLRSTIKQLQKKVNQNNLYTEIIEKPERIQQLEQIIVDLKKQLSIFEEQKNNLHLQLIEKDAQILKIQQKKQEQMQLQQNLQVMTKKIKYLEINLKKKTSQLEETLSTNQSLNNIIQENIPFTQSTMKQVNQLQDKLQISQKQKLKLVEMISVLKKQKLQLQKQHQNDLEQTELRLSDEKFNIMSLEQQNQSLKSQITTFEIQLKNGQMLKQKMQPYQQQIKQLKIQINQKIQHIQKLSTELQSASERSIQLDRSKNNIEEQFKQKQSKVEELNKIITVKDKQCQQLMKLNQENKKLIQSKDTMINFLKNKSKENDTKFNQIDKKYKSFLVEIDFKNKYPNQKDLYSLFLGDILTDRYEQTYFLKNAIEKKTNNVIKRTKLLYQFQPLNKVNFHLYMDNIENIVALVELQNGMIIAAYSQGKFYPNMTSNKDGLLISITNQQVFELVEPNKKAIAYDQFYFIAGNSQFRVRNQQAKFFSNFGVNGGSYKTRGKKVDVLIGTVAQREVPMSKFEIYQLAFY